MFSSKPSTSALIAWCQALHHSLSSGLSLFDVFRLQSRRGPKALRGTAERITTRLKSGDSLEEAIRLENCFPPLFVNMTAVGEKTGRLPEVFEELEHYYTTQQTLRRDFIARIAWPVFQFVAAVFIIAFVIFILGYIADTRNAKAAAPIGFGLTGTDGAIRFLLAVAIFLGGLFGIYHFLTRNLRRKAAVEGFLLRLPVFGPCIRAVAMSRLCLGLKLTLDSELPPQEGLLLSLRATGNAAFMAEEDAMVSAVRGGSEIAHVFRQSPLFPEEFVAAIEVGEVSGQIPEVLQKQAKLYRDEASRRLKAVARLAGFAVWFAVAAFMIYAIFSIASIYFDNFRQLGI